MKRRTALLLQVLLIGIGCTALFSLIRLPQTEGRAKNLELFQIYTDPLILYGYSAALVFFYGLYKVIRLAGLAGTNNLHSPAAIHTVRHILYAAVVFGVMLLLAAVYIRFSHHPDDDPAGFIALCSILVLAATIVSVLAFRFLKKLKQA